MNTRIKGYRTIISPSFSFCPTILYFGTQENIDKLQLLQNRCLRIILKCDRYTSISNMLECLGLMNVKQFLFLQTMSFVYNLYHRQLPAYLNFTLVNEIHDHETRSREHILLRGWGNRAQEIHYILEDLRNLILCKLKLEMHQV